ncbi:MAG: arginine--tRNA ligase [Oligoflexus sp.]
MTESQPQIQYFDFAKGEISRLIHLAFQELVSSEQFQQLQAGQILQTLERPPEAQMGDYAFPCFRFAKPLQRKPQDIAEELAKRLREQNSPWLEKVSTAGAFLNIVVNPGTLAASLLPDIIDEQYFERLSRYWLTTAKTVMVEYSQPNTHKIFHVGHMRNVALGDSLGRIFEYCGYQTTFANYIGDEGAHIAKCLWYIQKNQLTAPDQNRGKWLGEIYVKATHQLEDAAESEQEIYKAEISKVLRDIESKQGPTYEYWLESRQWSLADFEEIYQWTGARFDVCFHESDVSEESQEIVNEYLSNSVFIEDDGAIGIDLKDDKLGFLILRKRDGNTTYATKDLALARRKYRDYKIDQSIYVVGSEQNLHFKQVFKTLEKMGFEQAKNCYHLSYGMVVLPEGKMSSRTGNVIAFDEMKMRLSEELTKQLAKYENEWSAEELADANHKLSVGAIRYGMICSDPVKEIVFDLTDWLSFEGNTGPYLMYSYARTSSILRKAEERGFAADFSKLSALQTMEERELLRYMSDFNNLALQSCEMKKPSILAHHLFDMCKVYNRFFAQVPVLKAEQDDQRAARLALLQAFTKVLKRGLNLLGMTPPERM